jgi:hypothetical protein
MTRSQAKKIALESVSRWESIHRIGRLLNFEYGAASLSIPDQLEPPSFHMFNILVVSSYTFVAGFLSFFTQIVGRPPLPWREELASVNWLIVLGTMGVGWCCGQLWTKGLPTKGIWRWI